MLYRLFLVSFLGLKLSCDNQKHPPHTQAPIARVHNHYLYKEDIKGLPFDSTSPQDSLELIKHYVQTWLTKNLLAHKAESQGGSPNVDIEKKIAEFRSTLLVHNYIERLVNAKLNKEITEQEIQDYYQANQENFKLKHNIVRGKFVIIPKNSPNSTNLKTLITSKKEQDAIELKAYCSQFAKDYSVDESIWLKWDDIVTKTPFYNVPDKTRLLKKTAFTEVQDKIYRYYLKIEAYKITNDIPPLELVSEQVAKIIRYKRKMDLIKQIKEDILQQAKANNDYTIYEETK